ncbi:hypothetical protein COU79_02715 [Candidatus Peregrinibacteria bacterium CG10_big_fil_rev_8_21_14_0_10_54_7]|nr:MAG: hypothetical protein COU79_02715 [Candidatus Peregrinibacteria bacterium CG10_big_fil_rev_8_21_14_0_10_54_7]
MKKKTAFLRSGHAWIFTALVASAATGAAAWSVYEDNATPTTETASTFRTASVIDDSLRGLKITPEQPSIEAGGTLRLTAEGDFGTATMPVRADWFFLESEVPAVLEGCERSKTCDFRAGDEAGVAVIQAQVGDGEAIAITKITIEESLKNPFKDELPSWALPSVVRLHRRGIVRGYDDGRYGPGDPLTRGQIVTLIHRMLTGLRVVQPDEPCQWTLKDVPTSHYAYAAACAFGNRGWIEPKVALRPDDIAARADTAQFLAVSIGQTLIESFGQPDSSPVFGDVPVESPYFYSSALLQRAGIMTGYPNGDFGGEDPLNRAAAAAVVDRALKALPNADFDVNAIQPGPPTHQGAPSVVPRPLAGGPTLAPVDAQQYLSLPAPTDDQCKPEDDAPAAERPSDSAPLTPADCCEACPATDADRFYIPFAGNTCEPGDVRRDDLTGNACGNPLMEETDRLPITYGSRCPNRPQTLGAWELLDGQGQPVSDLPFGQRPHLIVGSEGTDMTKQLPITVTLSVEGQTVWQKQISGDPEFVCRGPSGCSIDGPPLQQQWQNQNVALNAVGKNGQLLAQAEHRGGGGAGGGVPAGGGGGQGNTVTTTPLIDCSEFEQAYHEATERVRRAREALERENTAQDGIVARGQQLQEEFPRVEAELQRLVAQRNWEDLKKSFALNGLLDSEGYPMRVTSEGKRERIPEHAKSLDELKALRKKLQRMDAEYNALIEQYEALKHELSAAETAASAAYNRLHDCRQKREAQEREARERERIKQLEEWKQREREWGRMRAEARVREGNGEIPPGTQAGSECCAGTVRTFVKQCYEVSLERNPGAWAVWGGYGEYFDQKSFDGFRQWLQAIDWMSLLAGGLEGPGEQIAMVAEFAGGLAGIEANPSYLSKDVVLDALQTLIDSWPKFLEEIHVPVRVTLRRTVDTWTSRSAGQCAAVAWDHTSVPEVESSVITQIFRCGPFNDEDTFHITDPSCLLRSSGEVFQAMNDLVARAMREQAAKFDAKEIPPCQSE